MELEYEVTSRAQFVAAVKAACRASYAEARNTPVTIKNGTTIFRFKEGIQEDRGLRIIRNIQRTPAGAFNVTDQSELAV